MLSEKQIEANKQRYLDLIESLEMSDESKDQFLSWLNDSDFFEAPASTKYHGAYKGGLCEHSLQVYDNLVNINNQEGKKVNYTDTTLKLVALLHDISKTNFYELYFRNVKNEITNQWEKVPEYRIRDNNNRFIFGNHEQNSEFIAHTFFPLSAEESCAILHHHGGMGHDSSQVDLTPIYNKYSLCCMLHVADLLACYIDQKIVNE